MRAVSLGSIVLHDECAERVRYAGDTCLGPAGGLLTQRASVVRPLARRVVEQHRTHSGYSKPMKLTACIITFNEADRIEACLRSVSFCDEIMVVDSHSTDTTRQLASALGARVIERDWPGYRSQEQIGADTAPHALVGCP